MDDQHPPPLSHPALRAAMASLRQMSPTELDEVLANLDAGGAPGDGGLTVLAHWLRSAHPGASLGEFVRDLAEVART